MCSVVRQAQAEALRAAISQMLHTLRTPAFAALSFGTEAAQEGASRGGSDATWDAVATWNLQVRWFALHWLRRLSPRGAAAAPSAQSHLRRGAEAVAEDLMPLFGTLPRASRLPPLVANTTVRSRPMLSLWLALLSALEAPPPRREAVGAEAASLQGGEHASAGAASRGGASRGVFWEVVNAALERFVAKCKAPDRERLRLRRLVLGCLMPLCALGADGGAIGDETEGRPLGGGSAGGEPVGVAGTGEGPQGHRAAVRARPNWALVRAMLEAECLAGATCSRESEIGRDGNLAGGEARRHDSRWAVGEAKQLLRLCCELSVQFPRSFHAVSTKRRSACTWGGPGPVCGTEATPRRCSTSQCCLFVSERACFRLPPRCDPPH